MYPRVPVRAESGMTARLQELRLMTRPKSSCGAPSGFYSDIGSSDNIICAGARGQDACQVGIILLTYSMANAIMQALFFAIYKMSLTMSYQGIDGRFLV